MINKHLELLGLKVEDKVTNFSGVITTISFDLYGCIQAIVTPPVDKNGEQKDSKWFDITRLTIFNKTPVMELPNFDKGYIASGKKGANDKPISDKT